MLHVKLFLYHPSLLCHSIVRGKTTLPHSLVWEGIDLIHTYILYIYIYLFKNLFSHPSCLSHSTVPSFLKGLNFMCLFTVSSVILHCFTKAYFEDGRMLNVKLFPSSSILAQSFHSSRKTTQPHSLVWEGIDLFIYIYI